MTTRHDDDHTFNGAVTFNGPVTIGSEASGAGLPLVLEGAFVLADITAGSKTFDLPAGAIGLGYSIAVTTALTFSAGTTTDVTIKIGTDDDDDGYCGAVALAGVAGNRYATAGGALLGVQVPGGEDAFVLTFTPSGGTPDLEEVSAGAGTVRLIYTLPA